MDIHSSLTKALFELLKLAPRYLATLSIAAGFCLLAPGWVLQRLGIFEFA
jgi:hypothetical protein